MYVSAVSVATNTRQVERRLGCYQKYKVPNSSSNSHQTISLFCGYLQQLVLSVNADGDLAGWLSTSRLNAVQMSEFIVNGSAPAGSSH